MNRNTRLKVLACVLVTAAAVLVGYAVAQDRPAGPGRRMPEGPGGMPDMMGGPGGRSLPRMPGGPGGPGMPGEPGRKEPAREVHRLLRKKLPKVDFRKTAFSKAIEFLSDQSGINMFVRWKELEEMGIPVGEKSEVSVKLTNVTVEKALKVVLEAVSSTYFPLGFVVDENVITISTRKDLLAAWNIHMKERAMAVEAAFPPQQAEHMGRMIGLITRMKSLCFDPQAVGVMAIGALKEDVRRKPEDIIKDLETLLTTETKAIGIKTQGLRNAIRLTLKDIYKRQGEDEKVLAHLRALIVENDEALQEAKKQRR